MAEGEGREREVGRGRGTRRVGGWEGWDALKGCQRKLKRKKECKSYHHE